MEYANTFLLAICATLIFQTVNSLECYTCQSEEGDSSCKRPIDIATIPKVLCNKTTSAFLINELHFANTISQYTNENNGSQYQCTFYEKYDLSSNKTETYRGCVPTQFGNYCDLLKHMSETEKKFNLTTCLTCDTDGCNSSNSLQISIVMVCIASVFLLFNVSPFN